MTAIASRIRKRLQAVGLSARAASHAAGLGEGWVRDVLNGKSQNPSADGITALAPILKSSPVYLLTGDGPEHVEPIRIEFYIGAGAIVMPIEGDPPLEYIELPPGARSLGGAAIVRGSSQMPALREGDTVFWGEASDPNLLLGLECVCTLEDGRVLVKTILKSSTPGRFTLLSHNDVAIEGVDLVAAAPVLWVKRALHR